MNRLIALVLVLMFTLSLMACGEDNKKNEPTKNLLSTEALEGGDTVNATGPQTLENTFVVTPENLATAVVDTPDYSLTVTGMTTEVAPGEFDKHPLAIDVIIENKSSEKEYIFTLENMGVNGLSAFAYGGFNKEAAPGEKISDRVKFAYSNVPNQLCDYYELSTYASFWFTAEDSDGNAESYKINIYPNGEGAVKIYDRDDVSADRLCYDENGVKITYIGIRNDEPDCYFYIENSTDESVSVSVTGTKLNGFECDGSQSIYASGGTANYGYIGFSNSDFENAGINSSSDIVSMEITMDLVFDVKGSAFGRRVDGVTAFFEN